MLPQPLLGSFSLLPAFLTHPAALVRFQAVGMEKTLEIRRQQSAAASAVVDRRTHAGMLSHPALVAIAS
jgi:hypothetical protein